MTWLVRSEAIKIQVGEERSWLSSVLLYSLVARILNLALHSLPLGSVATAPSNPVSGVALLGQVRPVLRKDTLDQEVTVEQGGFAEFRLR